MSDSSEMLFSEPPANILLVDDLPANLLTLEALLANLGQNLVKALSGEEALRLLLRQDFAVILLDLRMPGLNGFEVARLIRGRKRSRHTPIIFLTAAESPDFPVEQAYELGAVDYLVRPFVPVILRAKVMGFVELFQKTEQIKRQGEQLRQLERQEVQRRLAEEAQRQRAELLAEEARRKDEFLATLGHELRNPLAALRNGLHVLGQQQPADSAASRVLEMMERQAGQLAHLVNDLLDLSRVSRGLVQLRRERVEIASALARAAESVRPLMEERRHQLSVELPPSPIWVDADPARLEQVLVNLLTNAARYTELGGRIWLTGRHENRQAVLRVRDTGIGIRPELLGRIFEMFAHADRLPGRVQEGLGIGLTLVRSLVEQHGGTVVAHSAGLGQGSEFVVCLPALPAPPNGQQHRAPEAAAAIRGGTPPQQLRILIVDDNADGAETFALLLRLDGHDVRIALDGASALEIVRQWVPQAAFLDIGMPGMDGYELARRLRALAETRTTLLVAVTGYGQEEDRLRSQAAGFDHYLAKPAPPEEVQRLLARLAVRQGPGAGQCST